MSETREQVLTRALRARNRLVEELSDVSRELKRRIASLDRLLATERDVPDAELLAVVDGLIGSTERSSE